ncbi:type 1 phosphatases regulator ypi1-like [Physcomitrium patens]|uniref:Type 1 phosphatases regulator n=1 Tax=Physcomitrium patens TaxID=3218 RepID=A0A2K1J8X9_PHYPA|nr:hypothetical protein PHYPA_021094 [Physcomitrium patens]
MAQVNRTSATATETLQLHEPSTSEHPPQVQTLTLRVAPQTKKKVSWREDTVDNEHMMKKKSKICCIFHKDDDCDSDDGDDSGDKGKGKDHDHDHHHECNHFHDDANGSEQLPEHGSTSSS